MAEPPRETLEADVLIIGAGPAGLACAIRLAQLAKGRGERQSNAPAQPKIQIENVYVLEKAAEIGAHSLSGAVLDPRALRELLPDFESQGAPLSAPVKRDSVCFLTRQNHWKLPVNPPFLRNHGNYIISLNRFVRWLGEQAERSGVSIFPGFAGVEALYQDGRVIGVRTDDKGVDRNGRPKSNFQPGMDIRAKITVFAEGPRGSLTKSLMARQNLDQGRNPQVYALGVKELWDVPPGRIEAGDVIHTAGWPLDSRQYGGGFVYGLSDTQISLGLVAGLDAEDPRFDVHNAFLQLKMHPWLKKLLEGGTMIRYGAKTIPEGGYFSIPLTATDGAVIIGDAAGFLNSQRLKGIHLAMKTGMLAAEAIYDALARPGAMNFEERWRASWVKDELWSVRNYHQGFDHGFWAGAIHGALQFATGGRGVRARYLSKPGYERMKKLAEVASQPIERVAPDGKLNFDKLSDVFHSGTHHEEDQPCHLRIADFDVCNGRCVTEYGNPCQFFCPAAVYEMESDSKGQGRHLKINASNCIHCKTCDIADPYQIITWVPPEGGGGPHYDGM